KDEGLEVTGTGPDRTTVYARGTVKQLAKSLQVNMVRVTAPNGTTYNAAQNAPSLPEPVAEGVEAVIGLQPVRQFIKHGRFPRPVAPQPGTNVANAPPYLVKELLKAYDADAVPVTGRGQRIAILIDTLPRDDDTAAFWAKNQLPVHNGRVEKVNVKQ